MSLTPAGYRHRLIEGNIQKSLEVAGAVNIEGPKTCGKTWCSRYFANSEFSLVDPNKNFFNRRMAQEDPSYALKGETPRLIDEWQDVPKIWDAVRYEVDTKGEKGSFILTGSSSMDRTLLSHSGAGRIIDVRMRTMSLYESGDSSGDVSLMSLFGDVFSPRAGEPLTIEKIAKKYLPLQRESKENFITIIAMSPADLITEGEKLHHCVGKMGYDQKFVREETLIFFIRNKDNPESPFVTIEYSLSNHKVLQSYGDHDSKPDENVLHYINKIWLPYANKKLKSLVA